MTEITINLDQYNLLFEKAMSFEKIVEAVKYHIDRDDIYPVKDPEILLLTGLIPYQREHVQAMANRAESKIARQEEAEKEEPVKEEPETEEPEEGEDDAEDQTER